MAKPKPTSTDTSDRIRAAILVVFDSHTRKFGYFAPDHEESCEEFTYSTAYEATEAAMEYAETAWDADFNSLDLTIEGGDADLELLPPNIRIITGPAYRKWLNGHLYEMSESELDERIAHDIVASTRADEDFAERWAVPIGQAIEAATLLHKLLYPDRKRGSNAPTQGQFLDNKFASLDKSTRQRNHSAFLIVADTEWPQMNAGYVGTKTGLARIFDAARQFRGKPPTPPRTPVRDRYRILVEKVREGNMEAARKTVNAFEQEDIAK
jgi:hypothetical protein